MKLQTRVSAIFDRTSNLLAFFGASLIIFIMLAVSLEITVRQFLGISVRGLLEVTEYALLYITFSGAAWLLKREGHVKMDLVLNRLRPRAQSILNMITSAVSAIALLIIVRYSARATWEYFLNDYYVPGLLEPPQWAILIIIPIGSLLVSIQFLRRTYGYLTNWRALSKKTIGEGERRWNGS